MMRTNRFAAVVALTSRFRFMRISLASLAAALLLFFGSVSFAQTVQVVPTGRVRTHVNVRVAPTTDAAIVGRLDPGQSAALIGDVPDWYRVRLSDGREGFVSRAWTSVASSLTASQPRYRIHLVDVGTGLAVFVEGPDFALLYDGGSNDDTALGARNRLLAYLRRVRPNLQVIDHLILSHPHRDHVELLPDVIGAYQVRNAWESGRNNPICGYQNFLDRIAVEPGIVYHDSLPGPGPHVATFVAHNCYGRARAAERLEIARGETIQPGTVVQLGAGARMTFLHADGQNQGSPNENSVVMRLDLGNRHILFMGDSEAGGRHDPSEMPTSDSIEGQLLACCAAMLRADVLVVGHHGSMTSSRRAFLDAVGASNFFVSVGPTRYATVTLPDQVVINELAGRGTVWRTDLHDSTCGSNPAKIGPDNDNQPGGCDNVVMDIGSDDSISVHYAQVAD